MKTKDMTIEQLLDNLMDGRGCSENLNPYEQELLSRFKALEAENKLLKEQYLDCHDDLTNAMAEVLELEKVLKLMAQKLKDADNWTTEEDVAYILKSVEGIVQYFKDKAKEE